MSKIITIYCEGKRGSHDFDILEKVAGDIATIKPIGGTRGAGAIIEFIEKGATKSDFYLFFRDRDFDCPIPSTEKLCFDGKKTYFSYRTTIENYLFDVSLFFKFVETENLKDKYKISTENDVKKIFIDAAKEIKNYQAVRHTLGKLRIPNSFDTTWVKDGSGHLPERLDLETCEAKGWKLISDVTSKNSAEWTRAKFQSALESFLTLFDDSFFNQLKFLIYFQGKDFAKSLMSKLPDFPLKGYYAFVKEHFDYKSFEDLKELSGIVKNKSVF